MARRRAWLLIATALLLVAWVHWLDPWGFQATGSEERGGTDAGDKAALSAQGAKGPRLEVGAGARRGGGPEVRRYPVGTWPASLDDVDRERDLHGVVVTPEGVPVAGARVRTESYPWRRGNVPSVSHFYAAVPGPEGVSGPDGAFVLRLSRGAVVHLSVESAGWATVRLPDRRAGERVRVVVSSGIALRIETVTSEGTPAPGVALEVTTREAPPQRVTTDDGGRARCAPLPGLAGLYVRVLPQPAWAREWFHGLSPWGPEHAVQVTVHAGRTVTGRVVDATDQRPLVGARLSFDGQYGDSVSADGDGRYTLVGCPDDGYQRIIVWAPGYGREMIRISGRAVVDLALARASAIEGRVLGPGASPLEGARVSAVGVYTGDGNIDVSLGEAVSGADGRFAVLDLRRGNAHRLVVQHEGYARALQRVSGRALVAERVDAGDIVLSVGRSVSGRVVDAAGNPHEGIEVRLVGPEASEEEAKSSLGDYGRAEEGRTDDLGRFRFQDLPPGRYVLMAVEKEPVRTSRELVLTPDADLSDLTLALPAARRLQLRPVDAEGRLVLPVEMLLRWNGGRRQDGLYDVRDLDLVLPGPARGLTVTLNAIDGVDLLNPEPVAVPDDAAEVRVVFRRASVVAGRLLDARGQPLRGALVFAQRGSEPVGSASTDKDGRFRIGYEGAEPVNLRFEGTIKDYDIEAGWGGEQHPLAAAADALAPGTRGVALVARTIAADRSLTVRVVDPEGRPVPGVAVSVRPRPPGAKGALLADAQGRLALTGLTPARLALQVVVPEDRRDAWWASLQTGIQPGGQTVELLLRRPRFLEGVLTKPDGAPLAEATVSIDSWDEPSVAAQTDAYGRFRLPLDPDGMASVDLEAIGADAGGTMWRALASDVPVGAAVVRLVAEPHDGIVR